MHSMATTDIVYTQLRVFISIYIVYSAASGLPHQGSGALGVGMVTKLVREMDLTPWSRESMDHTT